MIFARPNHIPTVVLERLDLLIALLAERRAEFEAFAQQVHDRGLRDSVLELAQECNQYGHELLGQFEMMAGRIVQEKNATKNDSLVLITEQQAVLHSCQISEQKIITAYNQLIRERFLDDELRGFLRNQLQGLTCSFTKIKLLNSLLVH